MRGYTKRVEQENNPGEFTWLYSSRVLDLLTDYQRRFPDLFEFLVNSGCQDPYLENIYPSHGATMMKEIRAYLATLPTSKQGQQTCGAEFLDENILDAIQQEVQVAKTGHPRGPTRFRAGVNPRLMYKVRN